MIHSFDLLDLPTLHRYRHEGLCTDSAMALTWGVTLVPAGALLSYLAPATGIFTFLSSQDGRDEQPVLGQVNHGTGSAAARLTFLAPETAMDSTALFELLDHLAAQVGERGAHNLLAEVDESTRIYEALRQAGFGIYSRQRIWKVAGSPPETKPEGPWRPAVSQDEIAVRTLYHALVPAMVQQVEPPPWERLRGMVHYAEGNLLAYVDLIYGPRGIILQPFVHPDMERATAHLADLIHRLPNRLSRPVYVCVRSYQSWLEAALEAFEAEPGPRQAVMVKRLAVALQQPAHAPMQTLKGTRANPTVPITRTYARSRNITRPATRAGKTTSGEAGRVVNQGINTL